MSIRKVVAIIPARGGSKRLPRKNILPLSGKPLITWTIEAAKKSKYITDIIISTDDLEISNVASKSGVDIPEFRPPELATDTATTESVLFYTIDKFTKDADIIVLLQPTSPLRTYKHIDEAIELLVQKEAFSIVSVTHCEHPLQWSNFLPGNRSMKNFIDKDSTKRSQDYDKAFRLNGAIYVYDVKKLVSAGEIQFREDTYAYIMPNMFSIDIDCENDFDLAEFYFDKYAFSDF